MMETLTNRLWDQRTRHKKMGEAKQEVGQKKRRHSAENERPSE